MAVDNGCGDSGEFADDSFKCETHYFVHNPVQWMSC